MNYFSDELLKSKLITDPSETLDTLMDQYNDSVSKCFLDKHAPMKTKTFVQRATITTMPRYHGTIWLFKQQNVIEGERNDYEMWLVVHQHMHREARNRLGDLTEHVKSEYYN